MRPDPDSEESEVHAIFDALRTSAAVVVDDFTRRVMHGVDRARSTGRGSSPSISMVAGGFLIQLANLISAVLVGEPEEEEHDGDR